MPAKTQKSISLEHANQILAAEAWIEGILSLALLVLLFVQDLPIWIFALLYAGIWILPGKMLRWLIPRLPRPQPRLIQTDSGDTWVTDVPSILVEDAVRSTVRLPFRALSGLIALVSMILATAVDDGVPLLVRIIFFLVGVIFGAIALVPDGDLTRMLPRISRPLLPAAGGDADADRAGGADFRTHGEGSKIDG